MRQHRALTELEETEITITVTPIETTTTKLQKKRVLRKVLQEVREREKERGRGKSATKRAGAEVSRGTRDIITKGGNHLLVLQMRKDITEAEGVVDITAKEKITPRKRHIRGLRKAEAPKIRTNLHL
jgi:hypothetical protein